MYKYKITIKEKDKYSEDLKVYCYKFKREFYHDYLMIIYNILQNNFECDRKIVTLYYNNEILRKIIYGHDKKYSIKIIDEYTNYDLFDKVYQEEME